MSRTLVIGIGSLVMMDDGIGTRVADAIKDRLQGYGIITVIGETDAQYCLDEIKKDDFLVIIDAMMQGKEPGSLNIIQLHDAAIKHSNLHFQHDFSLIDAVLHDYPDIQGYLIGIEASEIGFGVELSEPLRQGFDCICKYVFNMVVKMSDYAK